MKLTSPETLPLLFSSSPQPAAPKASTVASNTSALLTASSLWSDALPASQAFMPVWRSQAGTSPPDSRHAAELLEEVALDEEEGENDRNRRGDRACEEEREVRPVESRQRAKAQ